MNIKPRTYGYGLAGYGAGVAGLEATINVYNAYSSGKNRYGIFNTINSTSLDIYKMQILPSKFIFCVGHFMGSYFGIRISTPPPSRNSLQIFLQKHPFEKIPNTWVHGSFSAIKYRKYKKTQLLNTSWF